MKRRDTKKEKKGGKIGLTKQNGIKQEPMIAIFGPVLKQNVNFFTEVCYLRLDFESFTLLGPSTTSEGTNGGGLCARDAFKVTVSVK
jgi:hypothetical protein